MRKKQNEYLFHRGATVDGLIGALQALRARAGGDAHVVMPDELCVKMACFLEKRGYVVVSDMMSGEDYPGRPEQLADREDEGEDG
jgi:hypothetical protein